MSYIDEILKAPEPQQVVDSVMNQLAKRGRGIVLLQDFHGNTAEALPELFRQLELAGYKVVHMVPKEQLTTIAKYDEMFNHHPMLSRDRRPQLDTACSCMCPHGAGKVLQRCAQPAPISD